MKPRRLAALDVDLELAAPEEVFERLPPTWLVGARRRGPAPRLELALERSVAGERLLAGGEVLAAASSGADRALWLARLEQEIVAAVARASFLLWLHAGAVLWRGRALVLPGTSFAGKSTLVAALLGRGATYLSDEWVAIDGSGRVHALPRPLRLREGAAPPASQVAGAWPLAATAVLQYHPRPAAKPALLAPAAALSALLAQALAPLQGGSGLAALAAVLSRPFFGGQRGDAEVFLDSFLGRLEELGDAA